MTVSPEINLLVCAMREQTEQLARIADLVLLLVMPPTVQTSTGCPHPSDQRIDFSAGGVEEFHCKACGLQVSRTLPQSVGQA